MNGTALIFHPEFVVQNFKFTGQLPDCGIIEMLHFRKFPIVPEQIMQSAHGLLHNIFVLIQIQSPFLYNIASSRTILRKNIRREIPTEFLQSVT